MQTVHDLLDARGVVPPVDKEDVDVVRTELLQRCLDGHVQRLYVVPEVLGLLVRGRGEDSLEVGRVLYES